MTILTNKEIEQYRGSRVEPLEIIEGISGNTLEKLKSLEEKIIDSNSSCYGLPFYLAYGHHPGGKSVISLSRELGVNQISLRTIFSYFDIPTLNRHEAITRLQSDPEFHKKRNEGIRRNSKQRRYGNISKKVYEKEITRSSTLVPSNVNSEPMERGFKGVGYREVVRAYDKIIIHTDHVGDWKKLIHPVSEKTGAESEFVESCLKKLFEIES